VARVEYHPAFAKQYETLCQNEKALEIAGEVTALLTALEDYGHEIEGEQPEDASHPIVTSQYHMFALRRTPPTIYTPYADAPPIIRIAYVWFFDSEQSEELAVVMLMGDKRQLGNQWYPTKRAEIEGRMIADWQRTHPTPQGKEASMTEPTVIPDPPAQLSDEDFRTATGRVRTARERLLQADAARAAHDALVTTIGDRVARRRTSLAQLRKAVGLTQAQVADTLGIDQAEVSKMERRLNHKLATLERFIQATGGTLRVSAVYGDIEVELNLGELLAESPAEEEARKPTKSKAKRVAKASVTNRRGAAAKKPSASTRSQRRREGT